MVDVFWFGTCKNDLSENGNLSDFIHKLLVVARYAYMNSTVCCNVGMRYCSVT
jgi:hypothetical protein